MVFNFISICFFTAAWEGRLEMLCLQLQGSQVRVSFLDPLGREGSGQKGPFGVMGTADAKAVGWKGAQVFKGQRTGQ